LKKPAASSRLAAGVKPTIQTSRIADPHKHYRLAIKERQGDMTACNKLFPSLFDDNTTQSDPKVSSSNAAGTVVPAARHVEQHGVPEPLRSSIHRLTVEVYTRHSPRCPHFKKKSYRRCKCPKWLYINCDGQDSRISARTRSWKKAEELRREKEDALDPLKAELKRLRKAQQSERAMTADAIELFLADAQTRNLKPRTLRKYRLTCSKRLLLWCEKNGLQYLDELTTSQLTKWRTTWQLSPLSKQIEQGRVVTFFEFCVQQGWLNTNPARRLSRIQAKRTPTDYFRREEFEWLIKTTFLFGRTSRRSKQQNWGIKMRTMILLMRWSGLRISDAVPLQRSRLVGDSLLLYQAKTGVAVYVPLPPEVAQSLRDLPSTTVGNSPYFFWDGVGNVNTAISLWCAAFQRLFKLANIRTADGKPKRCHAHMLRHTFAVELLLADVPIEQVAMLLGHSSVKTTERYYAPWVHARQEQLERSVCKAHSVANITKSAQFESFESEHTLFDCT
jgi:integrase/recombinase XerD